MKLLFLIKETPIYFILIHARYFINRYILNFTFSNLKINNNNFSLTPVSKHISFFGYYNLSPSNKHNETIFLEVRTELVRGSLVEPARIMIKNTNGQIKELAQTKSWNWQQGCMLQWLPLRENEILFNDYDELQDRYVSKVIDKRGNLLKTYDLAVNNVSKTGDYALCLNYDRLAKMRPDYGYFSRINNELPTDEQDGIWYLNLKNGACKLIITLDQLKKIKPVTSMDDARHKVNHIDINPSGNRFMFLHRWIGPTGRFMRLITANPDGTGMKILNGDAMTSHCCWLDDIRILSYCKVENLGTGYFTFDNHLNEVIEKIAGLPEVDGHPSVSPDGNYIITDTYPDKARMSRLYLFDLKNRHLVLIGRFHQPLRYLKEKRIDLHPKWSIDGKRIYFESGHKAYRKLYRLYIEDFKK